MFNWVLMVKRTLLLKFNEQVMVCLNRYLYISWVDTNWFHNHFVTETKFKGKGGNRRKVSYHTIDTRNLGWNKFKVRMDDWLGKGQWTHVVIRPMHASVNVK